MAVNFKLRSSRTPAAPRSSIWQRRVLDPILAQLTQGATSDKIALTVALGVACGMFPFLGFTTLLCFVVAVVLKLNQPIIHVVNQLLWIPHLLMIGVYIWLGEHLFSLKPTPYNPQEIADLFKDSPREFWQRFGLIGLSALVAWLITVPFIVAAVYYPVRPVLKKLVALRLARAAKEKY